MATGLMSENSLDCLFCLIADSKSVLIRQELRNIMKASANYASLSARTLNLT